MGVEPEDHPALGSRDAEREARGGEPGRGESAGGAPRHPVQHEPMSRRNIAILGAVVGVLYAAGMVARGAVAPGLVGGLLAGILCFLVLREVGERQRRRLRARDRSG